MRGSVKGEEIRGGLGDNLYRVLWFISGIWFFNVGEIENFWDLIFVLKGLF